MSGIRFKRLQRYQIERSGSTMTLAIPPPRTAAGKVDRDCPGEACDSRRFQLGTVAGERIVAPDAGPRMRRAPSTPGTTCPYCGHDDADQAFTTSEDVRAALDHLKWAAREDAAEAFGAMLDSAFRGSKFIQVKRSSRLPRPAPRSWREDLLREIDCTACGRPYGVCGFALFCPDCGAANLSEHFTREKDLVEDQLAAVDARAGAREAVFRALGNALEDVVTALETALRGTYVHIVRRRFVGPERERKLSKQAIGNRFQSLRRGTEAFQEFGLDPYGCLTASQRASLEIALAKRHVIAHNQGIVDATFVSQTGAGVVGRPITLSADEIRESTALCAAVLAHLERACPELLPRAADSTTERGAET